MRSPALIFAALGVIAAATLRGRTADAQIQIQLWAAAVAFLLIGGAVERLLAPEGDLTPLSFPWHRLALGQVALAAWLYLRSRLPLPGVTSAELWLLALAAGVFLATRAPRRTLAPAQALHWAALLFATFGFLSLYSGQLQPPSGDPDQHVFLARLIARAGRVVLDQRPFSDEPLYYPSAFAALNALWMQLSFARPVAVIDCQSALQACLAVGLCVEAVEALRGRPAPVAALAVIAVGVGVLVLPLDAVRSRLEGTARLAHTALWLLPLTLPLRLSANGTDPRRLRDFVLVILFFSLGWALGTNPAHLTLQLPAALGSFLAAALLIRGGPLWPRAGWIAAALAVLAVLLFGDAWVRLRLSGGAFPQVDVAGPRPPLQLGAAIAAGLRAAWQNGILFVPQACLPSARCGPALLGVARWLSPLLAASSAAALFFAREARLRLTALATVAVLASALAVSFLDGATAKLFSGWPGLQGAVLRGYTADGFAHASALLLLLLFGLALAQASLLARAGDATLALAIGVAALLAPGWSHAVAAQARAAFAAPRGSSAGLIDGDDIAFVRELEKVTPARDRVLLPCAVRRAGPDELWCFPLGTARALPLYSDARFAFFLGYGGRDFSADAYDQHVCRSFDAAWLRARGVKWLLASDSALGEACVAGWPALRPRLPERLRRGGRVLYEIPP